MSLDRLDANLRVDCYLAVMVQFQKRYPNAHFEVITRARIGSVLSPGWDLLNGVKDGSIAWDDFLSQLEKQIRTDPTAMGMLRYLHKLALGGKIVFLVCYEKDAMKCHRSLVKRMILGLR